MPQTERRVALRVLQAGAIAVVLSAAPYKTFDLDRFFVPKELAVSITALIVTLLCLARAKRLSLGRADQLLALWLLLGVVSAVFATNWWLAGRAVAVSLAGAACFWCARTLSRAGYARALVAALALAGVVGAVTALLQAYGVKTDLFSLNRAPGGTFGNRNFMAHLCVITLPALLFSGMRAPTRESLARWCGGLALVSGALILSRSRAAWLALVVGVIVLLVTGIIALRRRDGSLKPMRVVVLLVAAGAGAAAALVIPNTLDWKSDSPYADTAHSIVNYKGGSGHGRLIQYGNSLKMTLRHPLLGVGPGNWPVIYPKFASENDPSLGQEGMTSNPWPSSDWVTFLSERGPFALALIGLAVLALLADGMRGLRDGADTETRFTAAVFLATLVVLLIVGAFDAVLLLPIGALVGWSLLGALAPPSRERSAIELTLPRRLIAFVFVAAVGGLIVARSSAQLLAMSIYATSSKASSLERASTIDPGSYRIHARLAQLYLGRGDCKRSKVHAKAATLQFPSSPTARRLLASCGG
ncbi:MAG: tetratricopeptide repeat protein [bacterium]